MPSGGKLRYTHARLSLEDTKGGAVVEEEAVGDGLGLLDGAELTAALAAVLGLEDTLVGTTAGETEAVEVAVAVDGDVRVGLDASDLEPVGHGLVRERALELEEGVRHLDGPRWVCAGLSPVERE